MQSSVTDDRRKNFRDIKPEYENYAKTPDERYNLSSGVSVIYLLFLFPNEFFKRYIVRQSLNDRTFAFTLFNRRSECVATCQYDFGGKGSVGNRKIRPVRQKCYGRGVEVGDCRRQRIHFRLVIAVRKGAVNFTLPP